jgi:cystathionine beta-lyase/cystathionine gamma-synthase
MTTKKAAPKATAKTSPSKTARKPRARREVAERSIDLAKATNLALAGATYKQIASELEVDEETIRYQLLSAEGQRALRWAVNDLQERTDRFLASAHLQAIRRLVREMEEAEKSGDRIRAASAITMLAARRIEITGANGGAVEVDTTFATLLDERISRMRERSRPVIDTTAVTIVEASEPEIKILEVATIEPDPIPIVDVVPVLEAVLEATPLSTRTRQPAGLAPGQGLRARR